MPSVYRGILSRQEWVVELGAVARRMGVVPREIKVRPVPGSRTGIQLSFPFEGITIMRACDSQPTKDGNFACLVLWLRDIVRNAERRIETVPDAVYAEGGNLLSERAGEYGATRENYYRGSMTFEEAGGRISRLVERLGLTMNDIRVSWNEEKNEARIRLRLRSGRMVEKVSTAQSDARCNLAALVLWLGVKAKNYERGLEKDPNRLFAANLLPPGPRA